MKCLVSFLCIKNPVESAPEPPDIGTLSVQDDDACDGNEEGIHEEDNQDCESNDDLHAENFKVKGSSFQEHYQQSKFSFYACIIIVKRGPWGKDDQSNHYNSNIE